MLPDVDAVSVVLVMSVTLLPQGVTGIEIMELPAREFVAEESALGTGSVTSGLVTGSNVVAVGRPSIGLTPKLLISADPSGIPTRVGDDAAAVDGVAGALEDDVLEIDKSQLPNTGESVGSAAEGPLIDVVPFTPPPSKLEKVDVNPAAPEAAVGTSEQPAPPVELNVVGELDVGELKPPGLSSTAPRGIPVGAVAVRGDVVPIAGGVTVLTCATLGRLANSADIVATTNKLAIASVCLSRIGSHRRFRSVAVELDEVPRGVETGISPCGRKVTMPAVWTTLFRKRFRICLFARCREGRCGRRSRFQALQRSNPATTRAAAAGFEDPAVDHWQ